MTLKKFAEGLVPPAGTAAADAADAVVCMKMGAVLRFLQRYAIPGRPVTPYDLMGMDVPVVTALLDAMGIAGDLRTEVRSVLDPGSVQLRWEPQAGTALEQLGDKAAPVWLADAWCALHNRDAKATVGALPDTELPSVVRKEDSGAEGTAPKGTTLKDAMFAMADWAMQKVLSDRTGVPTVVWEWVKAGLNQKPAFRTAFPPLAVIEEAVYGHRRAGTQPVVESGTVYCDWSTPMVRPLKQHGEQVPAESTASMPLENIEWPPFRGYALKFREDWPDSRADATAAWLRTDIDILHHPDSLAVAASQKGMADWIADTIDAAFKASGNPGVKAAVMPYSSRLAVHNAKAGVPCEDEDTGDDARWTYMDSNASMGSDDVRYLANIVISTNLDLIAKIRATWETVPALTVPPKVVDKAEDAKATVSALGNIGLAAEELSTEWFAMVHGLPEDAEINDVDRHSAPMPAFEARLANLEGMRKFFDLPETHTVTEMSRPTSPTFTERDQHPRAAPFPPFLHAAPKLFMDKVATLLRKAAEPDPLPIVAMANRHSGFGNFLITGLWSGLVTDKSGTERNAECFPRILPNDGMTPTQLTEALGMLHADPTRQLRCASRTGSTHRRHVVAVETNIDYAKMMEHLRACQKELNFIDAMRIAWGTTFHFWDTDVQAPRRFFSTGVLPEVNEMDLDAFCRYLTGVHGDADDYELNFTTLQAFTTRARTAILDMEAMPDTRGRMVLLFATRSFIAIDAGKTAWRWLAGFPVLTASSRGDLDPSQFAVNRASSAVVADPSDPRRTYSAMLRAITCQAKFVRDFSESTSSSVEPFCGCAGVAWPETTLYEADLDEGDPPTRSWLAKAFRQTVVVP